MEKGRWIFLIVSIIFIFDLFKKGDNVERKMYIEEANGIVQKIKIGGSGNTTINLFNISTQKYSKHIYNNVEKFNLINIGDSIIKNHNSYSVSVYFKMNGAYYLKDSFEIGRHW